MRAVQRSCTCEALAGSDARSGLLTLSRLAVAIVGMLLLLTAEAKAGMPPPQQFPGSHNAAEKIEAFLLIKVDKYGMDGARALTSRTGSEYDTRGYCHVVLDFLVQYGAKGVFAVGGSATGFLDEGPEAPFTDEIPPISIPTGFDADAANGPSWFKGKTVVAPLRHDVTFFDWEPAHDSTGALYVWATPIPCGLSTNGF